MKTKTSTVICILLFALWGCLSFRESQSRATFDYEKWRKSMLFQLDSLGIDYVNAVSQPEYKKNREFDLFQIKDVINSVDSTRFQKMLNAALSLNKLGSWNRMYHVYSYHEGEIEVITSTFIFFSPDNKYWSISCSSFGEIEFYKAGAIKASDLDSINNRIDLYYNSFFTISKFDSDFKCISNKFIFGREEDYPAIDNLLYPR